MADYTFSPKTGRYRDVETGRFVAEATVREAVDRLADDASARLASLSERLLGKEITLETWQRDSMDVLKEAHVAAAVIAHGGREQMGQDDWGFVGHRLRDEYQHLREFARQIADGDVPLTSGVVARSRLYGQAVRITFETQRAHDDAARGMDEERNVLGGAEHHCSQCPALSAQGWVPLGTLPMIGSRQCGVNDRCSIARRRAVVVSESRPLLRRVV